MKQGTKLSEYFEYVRSILTANNIAVSEYKLIEYGLQFLVSTFDWSGIIRIYQNKKGTLKIDYSQLKDNAKILKIKSLIEGEVISADSGQKNVELGFPIIGTDESGKGDYFGPLVSAGVYVDERSARELLICGIKDSKKLSDSKNLEMAHDLTKICKGRFAIIEISPERYNDLYDQFIREKKNLNTLLAWGHARAIEEILSKVDCQMAVADQFADEKYIIGKLQEKGRKLRLVQMHKAEQHVAVAAASILARARFLEKLHKLSNEYKTDLSKGASRTVIENARKIVDSYGKETLRKLAKLHFKTTAEVLRSNEYD